MTPEASTRVGSQVRTGFRIVVRIVAAHAAQLPALSEAPAGHQPHRSEADRDRVLNFRFGVRIRRRQPVALPAHFNLRLRGKSFRVDDRPADHLRRSSHFCSRHMRLPGSVAALASHPRDHLGQVRCGCAWYCPRRVTVEALENRFRVLRHSQFGRGSLRPGWVSERTREAVRPRVVGEAVFEIMAVLNPHRSKSLGARAERPDQRSTDRGPMGWTREHQPIPLAAGTRW